MKRPEGHQQVIPYLILNDGNGFFEFTKKVFGATERMRVLQEDSQQLKHGEIQIGDSTIMFGQTSRDWGQNTAGLFIYVDDADETFRKALDAGATEILPLSNQDYGRSGGVKDPFGNTWWITAVQ
jgi:uncharacterized glyoxalase superfamily protein PhnB